MAEQSTASPSTDVAVVAPTPAAAAASTSAAPTTTSTAPAERTPVSSASPETDPLAGVDEALRRRFPAPDTNEPTGCSTYAHANIYIGSGNELDIYDDETRRLGTNIWSPSAPNIWIGDRDAAIDAFGALKVIPVNEYAAWLILYDPDLLGGWHYASELRWELTPAGNHLWYLKDSQVSYPDGCPLRDRLPGR